MFSCELSTLLTVAKWHWYNLLTMRKLNLFIYKASAALLICCALTLPLYACQSAPVQEDPVEIPEHTPVPTPTPTPSPTPTPVPTPSPTPVPEVGSAFYDAFFDDAVFVGDSITQGLQNYVIRERANDPNLLGSARFAAAKSYGLDNACSKKVGTHSLKFKGDSWTLPDLILEMQAEKVFIMLGVNDWAGSAIDHCIGQYRTAIENVRELSPDVEIYVQSCTPITEDGERPKLNNENMDAFNAALILMCEELGVHYVDIATPLKGEDNCLVRQYSSDNYVHMSAEGASVWVDTLYAYAHETFLAGEWSPVNTDENLL